MLNAAIVGMGRWGQTLVASVQGKSNKICFVRGVTRTPSKVEAFAITMGLPVSDFDTMLADPGVDAVVLATPHSQHVAQIKAAAKAGKQVFVDKPIALTAAGVERAFDACEAAGVQLAVGQNRRFLPSVRRMREMIAQGTLGDILHIGGISPDPAAIAISRATGVRARRKARPAT